MSETYTGFRLFEVNDNLVQELHKEKEIKVWDKRLAFYPNMYVELKSESNPKNVCYGKVGSNSEIIYKISSQKVSTISPRNREQIFAIDALMDDEVPVVVLTGPAGTGKTICCLAMALYKIEKKRYEKVIITKPMSQVGKYNLGILPGNVAEKFDPYLLNYTTNLEQFVGGNKKVVQDIFEQCKFEMVPIQLMRGASFNNSLIILDEAQVLNHLDLLTIGTRVGENSKIVIMGDLSQRDDPIAKEKTGIYKIVNDIMAKESPLISIVELQICERSATARFFANLFKE